MFFKQVSKNWILSALSLGAFQCLFAQSLSAHELQFELDEQRKLSEIQFPNGSIHRVSYDRDGKVAENSRTGLGRIEYHRHPKLGFLQGKSYFNSEGKLDRTESYEYDDQARLVTLRQTLAEPTEGLSGDRVFRFFYDGNLPSGAVLPGQVGRLTAVLGPDFIKTMEYAEGERIQSVTMEFPGWNQMTRQFEYDHSGRMREARLISEGAVTTSKVENYEWDASDRISKILFNGNPFATFGEGLENSVQLPNGDQISWIQDPVTQQVSGYEGQIAGVPVSQKWHRAAASGQIQSESLEVSGSVHQRDYHYSAQGLLSGESTTSGATKYFHDDAGLIHSWTDGDQKSLVESHDGNWAVEKGKQTQAYLLDSMGRVIYKQGRYFEYGPSGRVEKLTLPGQDPVFYSYDELGNRILKRTKARILEAYWGDVVIQDSRVMQPVRVRGLVVGVMQNNHFVPIASDRTGKAILGQDQCVDLATSYGERKSRPSECSSVLDSATHGFDSDLDAYRMGVRDYDSKMKRFLTPDPFFFENPQMCLSRPFECNLYSYAGGNPVEFYDPTGLYSEPHPELSRDQVIIDAFIPYATVHGFKGDRRGFGERSKPEQSRLTVWLDLNTGVHRVHVSPSSFALSKEATPPSASNKIEVTQQKDLFEVRVNAKNSAFPFELAPPIVNTIQVMKKGVGVWDARMIGKAFPSWEIYQWSGSKERKIVDVPHSGDAMTGPLYLMGSDKGKVVNYAK